MARRSLALGLMLIMPQLHRDVTGLHVDVVLASDFPTFFLWLGCFGWDDVVNLATLGRESG